MLRYKSAVQSRFCTFWSYFLCIRNVVSVTITRSCVYKAASSDVVRPLSQVSRKAELAMVVSGCCGAVGNESTLTRIFNVAEGGLMPPGAMPDVKSCLKKRRKTPLNHQHGGRKFLLDRGRPRSWPVITRTYFHSPLRIQHQ
jgi:hypothetical protein